MTISHTSISGLKQLRTETERIKVLKVVGEAIGQVVLENTVKIDAVKIIKIDAELRESTDHLFKGKIVKQGTIHKQIIFVDPEGVVRHQGEDVRFMLAVDIPGFEPNAFTEVQNHLLDIDVDFTLDPVTHCHHGRLTQKIVAHILVKASEWTQMDVVTRVDLFPKTSFSNVMKQPHCCC